MTRSPKPAPPGFEDDVPGHPDDNEPRITTEWYWAETRRRAEEGDHEASLSLIEEAAWALEYDQPMNPDVRAFLGRSLAEIVNGVSATEAFMLTKPKHRPKVGTADRDSALAAAMVLIRRENPGQSKNAAALRVIDWIGKRWGLRLPHDVDERDTTKLVVRAFDAYASAYERFDDDLLRQLALQQPGIRTRR